MPGEHARLLVRINNDAEFTELDPLAQWLYQRCLSRPDRNLAGVLPVNTKKWARMSAHITVPEVEKAMAVLVERRFWVFDDDTDEVLVRTMMRNDGVAKQPNVLLAALRAARFTESPRLKLEIARELRRMRPDVKEWQLPKVDEVLAELDPQGETTVAAPLFGEGSANPSSECHRKGAGQLSETLPIEPFGEPAVEHPGVGEGVGEGDPSPKQVVGESPAPTITDRLRAIFTDPDNDAPCRRHPDDDRNCNRCGTIRRKHPDGYDPRPPELIPDHQLDVDAWADPALVIAAPDEVELGDPAARHAWYRQAGVDQLTARRAQARQRLADYQARHPA